MLVVNGANKEKDYNWMIKNNTIDAEITDESDEYSLLAVQGPNSKKVIEKVFKKEIDIEYYTFVKTEIFGADVIVSRTGYTGELGYELYFKGDEKLSEQIWETVFEMGSEFDIMPTGLGCRDSLRLEMGYCLYGNDIDETTTTLEAGLGWITKLKKGEFIGKDVLVDQKQNGLKKKLVPIIFDERAFPRKDYEIQKDGVTVGRITSGTVSPILEKPIALGYLNIDLVSEGNNIDVLIRNKPVSARITKLPFIVK
jgi:aminomethyltransferase